MDNQYALAVYNDEKNHIREFLKTKYKNFHEVTHVAEIKNITEGVAFVELNQKNLPEILAWIEGNLEIFNKFRVVPQTSDFVKMLFVMDERFFNTLPIPQQDRVLALFLPIFRA